MWSELGDVYDVPDKRVMVDGPTSLYGEDETVTFGIPGAQMPPGKATLMIPFVYSRKGVWLTQGGLSKAHLHLRAFDHHLVHQREGYGYADVSMKDFIEFRPEFYGTHTGTVTLVVVYVLEGTYIDVRGKTGTTINMHT